MGQPLKNTPVKPLKTCSHSAKVNAADHQQLRAERLKADMQWQMNMAKVMLNSLRSKESGAKESFETFHNTARKNLWYIRRGKFVQS